MLSVYYETVPDCCNAIWDGSFSKRLGKCGSGAGIDLGDVCRIVRLVHQQAVYKVHCCQQVGTAAGG